MTDDQIARMVVRPVDDRTALTCESPGNPQGSTSGFPQATSVKVNVNHTVVISREM